MSAKKKSRATTNSMPLIKEPIDWLRIIQALTVAICTIITTWGAIKIQTISITSDRTEAKVDKAVRQTDGVLVAALQVTADATQKTAESTGKLQDQEIANKAAEALKKQEEVQKNSETPNP